MIQRLTNPVVSYLEYVLNYFAALGELGGLVKFGVPGLAGEVLGDSAKLVD